VVRLGVVGREAQHHPEVARHEWPVPLLHAHRGERRFDLALRLGHRLLRRQAIGIAQQRGRHAIGALAQRRTCRLAHGHAGQPVARAQPLEEFRQQPALAGTGLRDDADHLGLAGADGLEGAQQPGELPSRPISGLAMPCARSPRAACGTGIALARRYAAIFCTLPLSDSEPSSSNSKACRVRNQIAWLTTVCPAPAAACRRAAVFTVSPVTA
jgi:hypothetical protein